MVFSQMSWPGLTMSDETRVAVEGLAENALMKLGARLMALLGVPVAIGVFGWIGIQIVLTRDAVIRLEYQMTYGVERQMKAMDNRIARLENRKDRREAEQERRAEGADR